MALERMRGSLEKLRRTIDRVDYEHLGSLSRKNLRLSYFLPDQSTPRDETIRLLRKVLVHNPVVTRIRVETSPRLKATEIKTATIKKCFGITDEIETLYRKKAHGPRGSGEGSILVDIGIPCVIFPEVSIPIPEKERGWHPRAPGIPELSPWERRWNTWSMFLVRERSGGRGFEIHSIKRGESRWEQGEENETVDKKILCINKKPLRLRFLDISGREAKWVRAECRYQNLCRTASDIGKIWPLVSVQQEIYDLMFRLRDALATLPSPR